MNSAICRSENQKILTSHSTSHCYLLDVSLKWEVGQSGQSEGLGESHLAKRSHSEERTVRSKLLLKLSSSEVMTMRLFRKGSGDP